MFKKIKCLIGFHGCYCEVLGCNKAKHVWDGCKCTLCGSIRDEGHTWDGCKCTHCGGTRDEGHAWDRCKCTHCGDIRDEGHTWEGCKCTICGAIRDEGHSWNNCKCSMSSICINCGEIRTTKHINIIEIKKIFKCPECKHAVAKQLVANPGGEATLMLITLVAALSVTVVKSGGFGIYLRKQDKKMDTTYKSIYDIGCLLNELYGSDGLQEVINEISHIEFNILKFDVLFSGIFSYDSVGYRLRCIWRPLLYSTPSFLRSLFQ